MEGLPVKVCTGPAFYVGKTAKIYLGSKSLIEQQRLRSQLSCFCQGNAIPGAYRFSGLTLGFFALIIVPFYGVPGIRIYRVFENYFYYGKNQRIKGTDFPLSFPEGSFSSLQFFFQENVTFSFPGRFYMQETNTVLRGYSREAEKTRTEKENNMHSVKIMTALIAITFLVGPAAVYAANSDDGTQSQYQNRYENQTQNTIQNRYQKNDSSRNQNGSRTMTRKKTTTTTNTRSRKSR